MVPISYFKLKTYRPKIYAKLLQKHCKYQWNMIFGVFFVGVYQYIYIYKYNMIIEDQSCFHFFSASQPVSVSISNPARGAAS